MPSTSGIIAMAALALAGASAAAEVKGVGKYRDWRVYTQQVGRDLVCFAAVDAFDKAPRKLEHGQVTFYVATWRSGSASNQPSLKTGYTLRTDIAPLAVVGGERFPMYAAGTEAFVEDAREKALVAALKKGAELRVEAARKDARTAYYFSLKGSSDAIDKARAACR